MYSEPSHNVRARLEWLLVLAYVASLPFQYRALDDTRFALADVVALFLLLLTYGRRRLCCAWSFWHVGLALCIGASLAVSHNALGFIPEYAWFNKGLGYLVLLMQFGLVAMHIKTVEQIRTITRLFVAVVAVQNLVAMSVFAASRLAGFELDWINYGSSRLAGFMIDPNAYGGLLVIALAMELPARVQRNPLFGQLLCFVIEVTIIAGIVLTYSRSAWIGLLFVIMSASALRPALAFRFAAVACVCALLLFVWQESMLPEFIQMATRADQINQRLEINATAMDLFADAPVTGIGMGVYYARQGIIIHNTILWLLTESGAVAAFMFVALALSAAYSAFLSIRRRHKQDRGLPTGLLLAHVSMLGLSLGIEALYQRHWWLVMALIWAYRSALPRTRVAYFLIPAARQVAVCQQH